MNARDFVLANNQICAVDGLARQLLLSKPSDSGMITMVWARVVVPDPRSGCLYNSWVWVAPGSAGQLVEL